MLPFLLRKRDSGVVTVKRGAKDLHGVKTEVNAPGVEGDPGLEAAAEDVLRAVDSRSVIDLAKALHNAFQICDAMPHEEGEHEDIEGEE